MTDLGIYHFDESGEMRLDSIHPGATLEQIRETMGWEPKLAEPLRANVEVAVIGPRGQAGEN